MQKTLNEILGFHLPCFCSIDGEAPRLVVGFREREHFYFASCYDAGRGVTEVRTTPKAVKPLQLQDDLPLFLNPIIESLLATAPTHQYWAIGPYCWGRGMAMDVAITNCLDAYSDSADEFMLVLYEIPSLATAYVDGLGGFNWYADHGDPTKTYFLASRNPKSSQIYSKLEDLEDLGIYMDLPTSHIYSTTELHILSEKTYWYHICSAIDDGQSNIFKTLNPFKEDFLFRISVGGSKYSLEDYHTYLASNDKSLGNKLRNGTKFRKSFITNFARQKLLALEAATR